MFTETADKTNAARLCRHRENLGFAPATHTTSYADATASTYLHVSTCIHRCVCICALYVNAHVQVCD